MRHMKDSLSRYGIVQNKTFTITPWYGPKEVMRHYWRGVFDGDGSIFPVKRKDYPNRITWGVNLRGTKAMITAFAEFLEQNGGSNRKRSIRLVSKKKRTWGVDIVHKADVQSALKLLYEGTTLSLDRKRKLAFKILRDAQD